ncbi:MAG: nucleotide exchange factor GrpE [Clostridia bacterium]|nr:nucleotide exchange factor GrpE [Clostridia bacterium]
MTTEEKKEPAAQTEPETAPPAKADKPKKSKKPDLSEKLAALQQQLDEQKDQHVRVLAEYANYKRRTEQEKEQIGQYVKADVLGKLLPLLDNLDRAAAAPDGPQYKTGVDMIIRQLHETLTDLGVTEIDALGQPFDPEWHYAVLREDAPDGVEPDTVTEVLQTGYKLGDKLLRPAMVKVAN